MDKGKIKIDTLIISDIHLGGELTRHKEILKVLSGHSFKRLILNGDILDGLPFKRLHSEDWDVLSRYRELSKNHEVVWVHGNHDADSGILSRLLGLTVRDKFIWHSGGKKFLAIHGHQFDRFLNDNFIISRLAFFLYYWLKRYNSEGYFIRMIKSRNQTWKRNSLEVARGALKLGWREKADFVFCGHTHIIDTAESRGVKYFNSGSWTEKPSAYIVETGGRVELIQVE